MEAKTPDIFPTQIQDWFFSISAVQVRPGGADGQDGWANNVAPAPSCYYNVAPTPLQRPDTGGRKATSLLLQYL